jgi:hypothetical protein
LRLPTASAWNTRATIEGEAREHEAGHAASAHLLGFVVTEVSMDAKWADFGELGRVSLRWPGTTPDTEEFAFARATIARAGPLVTDSWELDSSSGDRSKVEEVRWPAWSSLAWEFLVIGKTERLVRAEPFRRLHRRVVAELEEVGDTGTLSGDALARALTTTPTPASFQGRCAPPSQPPPASL